MTPLASYLSDFFARDAVDLGAHWQARARSAVPLAAGQPDLAETVLAARLVAVIAAALPQEGVWQDDVMRAGWELGAAAQASGYTSDALLTELELFTAILLYAAERHVDALDVPRDVATTPPTETFAVIRRLHEAISLLTLAATRGHTQRQVEGVRSHFRSLRHDLRNPIGTIQSAAALMQDESLPAEQRSSARYADMVSRNAQSLEDLIARELTDGAPVGGATPSSQRVSLRDLALAVRRAVRAEAERAECRVDLDDGFEDLSAATGALELTLRSLLAATISALPIGSAAQLAGVPAPAGRARVAIITQPPLSDPDQVAAAARSIAECTGATVGAEEAGWVWAEVAAG
ncbi:MAG: histidine kinase dimerization/phospho-acceptor domain-containing protein [Gemmatimonadaceae bacterium]